MARFRSAAIVAIAISAFHGRSLGRDYYVSPGGADSNPGTLEAPWKTLARAAGALEAGDVCHIRAGIYRETLRPGRSGTAGAPITFSAFPGEAPLITGADPVTGWTLHSGSVHKAPMPWSLGKGLNQVFADGAMMIEARFPNTGSDLLRPTLAAMASTATEITSSALTQPAGAWVGGVVHGWMGESWTAQGGDIIASAPGRLTVTRLSSPWFIGQGNGYVTGVLAALDAPTEWHYQDSTLYFWTPDGRSPAALSVEAKRRMWAIDLGGRDHVHVKGVWTRAGAIRMDGSDCVLEGVRATYLSHFTHTGKGYDGAFQATEGWNGVYVAGTRNTVKAGSFAYSAGSGIVLQGTGNRVVDCHIHDVDYQGVYSSPVKLGGSGNILEWSTLSHAGRDILHIGGSRHVIRNNDFSHPGMLTKDVGILYSFGVDAQGTEIAYNWVHDNTLEGPSPGIYIDNECKNYLVHHNVVWNCRGDAGIRVNGPADGHRIYNNTLFNADDVGTHTYINQTPGPYRYDKTNNVLLVNPAADLVDTAARDFRLAAHSLHVDKGQVVPGITDGFKGAAPDLGAYEAGGEAWKAGIRVRLPPLPVSLRPYLPPSRPGRPGGHLAIPDKQLPTLRVFDSRGRLIIRAGARFATPALIHP